MLDIEFRTTCVFASTLDEKEKINLIKELAKDLTKEELSKIIK